MAVVSVKQLAGDQSFSRRAALFQMAAHIYTGATCHRAERTSKRKKTYIVRSAGRRSQLSTQAGAGRAVERAILANARCWATPTPQTMRGTV